VSQETPLRGLDTAGPEATGVIASTSNACSSLTSVRAVLALYKAGGGPGTDPVFPKASSAVPGDRDWNSALHQADALRHPVSGSQQPSRFPQHQDDSALSPPTRTRREGGRERGVEQDWRSGWYWWAAVGPGQ
jgi:hypothetical protein